MSESRYNVYFNPYYGTLSGMENILLLPPKDGGSSGGTFNVGGDSKQPVSLSGELTIGGAYSGTDNIFQRYSMGDYKEGIATAIVFNDKGDGGKLNFAAQSGDVKDRGKGDGGYTESYDDSEIKINTASSFSVNGGSNSTYVASGNYESTSIYSSAGELKVISDMTGTIANAHTVSLQGYDVGGKITNNSSGNTVTGAAFRTQAMKINNNFSANINSTLSFATTGKASAAADNNTVTVQGIWAETGDFVCDGFFGYKGSGSINVSTGSIEIIADYHESADATKTKMQKCLTEAQYNAVTDPAEVEGYTKEIINGTVYYVQPLDKAMTEEDYEKKVSPADKEKYYWHKTIETTSSASANGNKIGAYGIRADNGTIVMNRDFNAAITTQLNNVTVKAVAIGKDQKASYSVVLSSYGMYAKNFSLSGVFNGTISASASNINLSASGSTVKAASSATITVASIYMEENISVDTYLSGDIHSSWNSSYITWDGERTIAYNVYGIYAGKSITIADGRGLFDTNITVSQSGSSGFASGAILTGIKAHTLNAESLGTNITIIGEGNYDCVCIGVDIIEFVNNVDAVFNTIKSTFDIIGDITVTNGWHSVGILVTGGNEINLRISSDITVSGSVAGYAIAAGAVTYNGFTYYDSGDDKIEIAAGATVTGGMLLGGGTNRVYVDSNAKLNGRLEYISGSLNLTFVLNRYGSVNGDIKTTSTSDLMFTGDLTATESTTILVDLNSAAYGETYYLMSDPVFGEGQTLTFVYQGSTKTMVFVNGTGSITLGNLTVNGMVDGSNTVSITVTENTPGTIADKISNSVFVKLDTAGNTVTCTLSNGIDWNKALYEGYDLVLYYTDAEGKRQSRKIENLHTSDTGNFVVDIDNVAGIKDVQAILTEKGDENARMNTVSISGAVDAETGKFRLSWVFGADEAISVSYRYELEYSVRKNGETNWSNSSLVTMNYLSTFYELNNVADGDTVRVRLRLIKVGSSEQYSAGEWSATKEFTNQAKAETVSKVTGLVDNRIVGGESNAMRRLEWDDMRSQMSAGLGFYEVQYFWAVDSDGNRISDLTDAELQDAWKGEFTRDGKTITVSVYSRAVSTNSFYLSSGVMNGAYYWRVRAFSTTEKSGQWSEAEKFIIISDDTTAPAKNNGSASVISPTFDYATKTITLAWSGELAYDEGGGSGLADYLVYYKVSGTDAYYTVRVASNRESIYSVSISGYNLNQSFDYYITAKDNAGNESEVLRGTTTLRGDTTAPTGAGLSVLDQKYETNTAGGLDFIVTLKIDCTEDPAGGGIDDPSGVDTYVLQYKKSSSGGIDYWITVGTYKADEIAGGSFTVTAPGLDTRDIPSNDNNECPTYWRLVVSDKAGNIDDSVQTTAIAVKPGKITFDSTYLFPPTVIDSSYDFTVTFNWKEAFSDPYAIASYTVYARVDGTSEWTVIGVTDASTRTLTVDSTVLQGDTTYQWAVNVTDVKGFSSGTVIASSSFVTPHVTPRPAAFTFGSVSAVSGYDDAMKLNVTISWTVGSGESTGEYVIQRAEIGSGNFSDYTTVYSNEQSVSITIQASQSYQYRIVAVDKNYGTTVISSPVNGLADTTKPIFTGNSAVIVQQGAGYYLSWSNATDPQGAQGEPVSGLKDYTLYFSTSSTLDPANAKSITITNPSFSLTRQAMLDIGITSGNYYWWVSAKDKAGNQTGNYLTNGESFFVDLAGPMNSSRTKMDEPAITVEYNYFPQPGYEEALYDAVEVRDPATITVKFDVSNNSYTDASGDVYFIYEIATDQTFSESSMLYSSRRESDYAYSTHGVYEGNTLTLSTENNGISRLAGLQPGSTIYWRIKAVDKFGNEAANYERGNSFTLSDPEITDSQGNKEPIQDLYTAPVTPGHFAVEQYSGVDETGRTQYLYVPNEWWNENYFQTGVYVTQKDGKYYFPDGTEANANYVYDLSKSNAFMFTWDQSSDAFGIKAYEIEISNGSLGEIQICTVDASLIDDSWRIEGTSMAGFSAGNYTFRVRALDGSGKYSQWSNKVSLTVNAPEKSLTFGTSSSTAWVIDNDAADPKTAYVLDETNVSKLGTVSGYREAWFKVGGTDPSSGYNNNYLYNSGYLNLNFTNVNTKLKVTVYNRDLSRKLKTFSISRSSYSLSNYLYNLGLYGDMFYIEVEATNKKTYDAQFTISGNVDYFPTNDLGPNSFAEAEAYENRKYMGGTGTGSTTVSDWVGVGDAADYWMFVGGTNTVGAQLSYGILNGVSLTGVQAKMKLSLYVKEDNGNFKRIASKSVSKDTANIFAGKMVEDYYYIVVESGDGGKGKQNSNYNLNVNETFYPSNHDSEYNPTLISLEEKKTGEWVGYGDPRNYYQFTVSEANGDGVFSVNLTTYSAKVSVTLYSVGSDGSLYQLSKKVSVKGSKVNILAKRTPVLTTGTYMLIVDAGNVKKASQNTSFDIQVSETTSFKAKQEANRNNDFATAVELTTLGKAVSGWVGINDAENFYKFQCTTDPNRGWVIKPTVRKGRGAKIYTALYDVYGNEIKEKNMAVGENYFLKVYTKDSNKYYNNDFTVTLQYK